ncbi:DNA-binding protein with HTH domain [Caulobacter sp. AP07]|uniref:helix-turn-helix transcriptional regulator n=1 Tax=Caulobacter sp. AP07 TaxID=1144304 RepID=UPI0002720735|nr:helix-turn-helix transcriptional regulator [Caulobacter sp. AP07]EJL27320.1 DNA-binding protein with HTH domain [Caulobacter sp. AP07]
MLDTDALSRLIVNIGRSGFDAAYFDLARKTLDVSNCTAFVFSETDEPSPIVLEGLGPARRAITKALGSAYVENGFRSDPAIKDLYSVSDLQARLVVPEAISDESYRRHYYDEPHIASEISVLGFFGRRRFSIGFYRCASKSCFTPADLERAQLLARVSLPVLFRHMELNRADPDYEHPVSPRPVESGAGRPVLEHLSAVLMAEGHGLTPREAQICASIVLGFRTLAISLNLGISENTICTHRKRAYAKLGISSQNELFSRYFRTVTRLSAPQAA